MAAPPSPTELLRLSDLNFAECLREHARWSERGVIDERHDTLRTLSVTHHPVGMFNAVIHLGAQPEDAATWLQEQLALFRSAQRGCTVYTRGSVDRTLADACIDAGLLNIGAAPGMVCDAPLPEPPPDPRLTLERIDAPDMLARWSELQASAYATLGFPGRVVAELTACPERMLGPHALFVLGRYDGALAAGGFALFSHGIAGLYWIGVHPDLRRRGIGEAVTRWLSNAAFERGARAVVLQASGPGLSVYKALGFRQVTTYPCFVAGRSRSSASPALRSPPLPPSQ